MTTFCQDAILPGRCSFSFVRGARVHQQRGDVQQVCEREAAAWLAQRVLGERRSERAALHYSFTFTESFFFKPGR